MKRISCALVRKDLAAYHDGELEVARQVAIRHHLASCQSCTMEADALGSLGELVRQSSASRSESLRDAVGSLHARVVARVQAEQPRRSTARRLIDFNDGHLLWVAGGATMATLVCLLALMGVMRMSLREVPSSLSAVIGALSDPGSNRNPVALDARIVLPRADPDALMPSPLLKPSEGWLAISAVVTREGLVRDVALLPTSTASDSEDQELLDLLDAATQTRFEPARAGGAPVAVNVVWLMAHTTVVGRDGAPVVVLPRAPIRRLRTDTPLPHATVPVSSKESPAPAATA
jgi:hypothetical protein